MSGRTPTVIGVTGNIGAGKSTVARMLGDLGAEVIDADQVAHAVMRAGTPVAEDLTRVFGQSIVGAGGDVDRKRLASIVFADAGALAQLEAIIHPATIDAIKRRVDSAAAEVVVIEAIKLIEAGIAEACESVWVVTCSQDQQIERTVRRGLSRRDVEDRIRFQSTQAEKIARADVVIDNGGSLVRTCAQVEAAWERLDLGAGCPMA